MQACLSTDAKRGSKVALKVKVGEAAPLQVCVLKEGSKDSLPLDLYFDSGCEWSVEGGAAVHVTGYLLAKSRAGGGLFQVVLDTTISAVRQWETKKAATVPLQLHPGLLTILRGQPCTDWLAGVKELLRRHKSTDSEFFTVGSDGSDEEDEAEDAQIGQARQAAIDEIMVSGDVGNACLPCFSVPGQHYAFKGLGAWEKLAGVSDGEVRKQHGLRYGHFKMQVYCRPLALVPGQKMPHICRAVRWRVRG